MILTTARGAAIARSLSIGRSLFRLPMVSREGQKRDADDEISGSEQPNQRQSRERLAGRLVSRRGQSDRGESCAYPKLSDSRSSARRAPVVPRVAAHVPSREKPTTDCQRSSSVPDGGARVAAAGGRDTKYEGRSMGATSYGMVGRSRRKEGNRAKTQGVGVRMSN